MNFDETRHTLKGYKPRRIERRFYGLKHSTWQLLGLALAYVVLGILTMVQLSGALDVKEAKAESMTDYREVYEEYEGQTLDVCAKYLGYE